MKSYRDLEIYKLSHGLAIRIHKMSLKLPKYEIHEEGGQIRRSSKGIVSCIVESYGRSRYKAEFIRFLIYAHASCDETIEHLRMIGETHDSIQKETDDFLAQYDLLGGKINKFLSFVEHNWKEGSGAHENL
jgi:four helix bundle protein